MSKIKVDEVESSSASVKLTSKGSGLVKVKGADTDGVLKLSSGTNGVKIKSPAHSAGQSYTMILPDNNIEVNKYLKVKSITGSGATAIGQLEYNSGPQVDLTSLSASNLTSGNMPAARFPSSLPATTAGLQLLSESDVGATAVSQLDISGFEADKMYLLIGKNISVSEDVNYLFLKPLDASGNSYTDAMRQSLWHAGGTTDSYSGLTGRSDWRLYSGGQADKWGFTAEISNTTTRGSILLRGGNPQKIDRKIEFYGTFNHDHSGRIHTLRITPESGNFTQYTQFLLYQYGES